MTPRGLRFGIHSCGGSSTSHPAAHLEQQPVSPVDMVLKNEGWQSPPYCTYPLEIVLEVPPSASGAPCRLSQLHILAHETKIPSRVWIFVGNVVNQRIEYTKLGYTSLANNRDQAFAVREYKTVYLKDVQARFVRLAVAEPHENQHNPTRQTGIVAINIMGHVGGGGAGPAAAAAAAAAPAALLPPPREQPTVALAATAPSAPLSPDAAHRLLEWTRGAYRDAATRGDAHAANALGEMKQTLADAMEQLHHINTQINDLSAQKKDAVASEDYAAAQQLHASLLSARGAMPPALEHLQRVAGRIEQMQRAAGGGGGGGALARAPLPPRNLNRNPNMYPPAMAGGGGPNPSQQFEMSEYGGGGVGAGAGGALRDEMAWRGGAPGGVAGGSGRLPPPAAQPPVNVGWPGDNAGASGGFPANRAPPAAQPPVNGGWPGDSAGTVGGFPSGGGSGGGFPANRAQHSASAGGYPSAEPTPTYDMYGGRPSAPGGASGPPPSVAAAAAAAPAAPAAAQRSDERAIAQLDERAFSSAGGGAFGGGMGGMDPMAEPMAMFKCGCHPNCTKSFAAKGPDDPILDRRRTTHRKVRVGEGGVALGVQHCGNWSAQRALSENADSPSLSLVSPPSLLACVRSTLTGLLLGEEEDVQHGSEARESDRGNAANRRHRHHQIGTARGGTGEA